MTAVRSIVVLTAVLCAVPCSAATATGPATVPPSVAEVQQAYEWLVAVDVFALGGVGIVGTTSDGELAFRVLLASPDALNLLLRLLVAGTDEGKLYALCGIRRLDAPSFASASAALMTANPEVTTQSGCMQGLQRAATMVKRIADGGYDAWCSK